MPLDLPALTARARAVTEPFADLFPWEPHFFEVPGGALHYLDEGPRSPRAVLAVHGNPTWSFYWRALVRALAPDVRVVVPDHLGMGLSDRPGRPVRLAEHVDDLVALVDALGLERTTLVCHDWGGAIGFGAVLARRQAFEGLVVTNTAAFPSGRMPKRIAMCRFPGLGKLAVQGLDVFAGLATRMAVRRPLDPRVRAGLRAPYRSWRDRAQVHAFVRDIPMRTDHPSWSTLCSIADGLDSLRGLPTAIAWGGRDWCFDATFRAAWEQRYPGAEVRVADEAGHYLMEDAPELVIDATRGVLRRAAAAAGSRPTEVTS